MAQKVSKRWPEGSWIRSADIHVMDSKKADLTFDSMPIFRNGIKWSTCFTRPLIQVNRSAGRGVHPFKDVFVSEAKGQDRMTTSTLARRAHFLPQQHPRAFLLLGAAANHNDSASIGLAQQAGVDSALRDRGIVPESTAVAFPRYAGEAATVIAF